MAVVDPGLQPERTELAWQRTFLALSVGALVSMRLLPDALGSLWWAVPGAVGVIVSGLLRRSARRRYRRVNHSMSGAGASSAMPDGVLLALTSALVAVGALAALVLVIAYSVRS